VTVNPVPAPLIVHVVYRFRVGGLENGVVNLVNRLPPQSWRHAIVSLTEIDEGFAARVQRHDVRYVALGKEPGHAFPLYPKLFHLFRELRPAIVHTRNTAALEASVPAWMASVPVRVHGEHGRDVGDLDGSRVRYRWARRAFSPFVTRYVAVSPDLARYLGDRVGIARRRIEQIYNGVDTVRFHPSSAGKTSLPGCPFTPDDYWLVGTVGRMEAVKDQTNLARAFVRALELHPEARQRMRLVMIGDGALRSQVEAILSASGAQDLAWLPGELSSVPALLQGLDCFVLPSLAEGVSNTILEAMATALPVIATDVGANGELVQDGSTGQLVPASDSEALARAMVRYMSDPAMAARHGRAGRQVIERRFSLDRMVDDYHRLYSELAARRTSAVPGTRAVARDRRTSG
jgi:sugar transferase (PEP-CTERM/EpsH1 system associated)